MAFPKQMSLGQSSSTSFWEWLSNVGFMLSKISCKWYGKHLTTCRSQPSSLTREMILQFYFILVWEKNYVYCNLSFELTIRIKAWQRDYVERMSQYSNIFLQVNMKKWVSTFIIGFYILKVESCDVSKVQIGSHEIIEKVLKCIYLKWDHILLFEILKHKLWF